MANTQTKKPSNNDGSRERQELITSVEQLNLSDKDKMTLAKNIQNALFGKNLNVLIVGATGCGKSTTIRALFDEDKMSEDDRRTLRISDSAKPQTMKIRPYKIGKNLTLWDSPGLGDGTKDDEHIAKIRTKCREKDENGEGLIDLGLVIVGGVIARDLEATYKAIDVLVEELCVGEESETRVVVAINKCDLSANPRVKFDYDKNEPSEELKAELDAKIRGFKARFQKNKSSKFRIMYYSAGYYDENAKKQEKPYNLAKLLNFITKSAPSKKRYLFLDKINQNDSNFTSNDGDDYMTDTQNSWLDSIIEVISDGIERVGEAVDKVKEVGRKVLAAIPVVTNVWSKLKSWLPF